MYNTHTQTSDGGSSQLPTVPESGKVGTQDRRGSDRPHNANERSDVRRHKILRHSATLLEETNRNLASAMSSPKNINNDTKFEFNKPEIGARNSNDYNIDDEQNVNVVDKDPLGNLFSCLFFFLFFLGGCLHETKIQKS